MKKESFVKGTVILIIANAISKILGAILKIPLTYILGEEGMAIYQTAFSVYIMLLALVTSGLPFAISKYIAQELTLNHLANVRLAMRTSVILMSILGILGTAIMYFGADFFAFAMKDTKAVLAIRAISPAVFFVALGAVYKSCYQGWSHMTPTAVSQVIEAFIKLTFGYFLASWFSAFSVKYSSAAAIFGVTIGEAFATLILFLMYIPYRAELRDSTRKDSIRTILSVLFAIAIPMTATSAISGGLSLLETSIIRNRLTTITFTESTAKIFLEQYAPYTKIFDSLISTGRLTFDGARWLFGAYSGYALTVFNLPCGILASLGVCMLPLVTHCITLKNFKKLDSAVFQALKITLIISIPVSVCFYLFSKEILDILFRNTASAEMLSMLSLMLPIVSVLQLLSSVQYSAGKIFTPFIFGLLGLFTKIILSYFLIHIPNLNIFGVIISSGVSAALQLILNFISLHKNLKISFVPVVDLLKLLLSSALTGFCAKLLYNPLYSIIPNKLMSFSLCMVISGTIYILLLALFNILKKEELSVLSESFR